MTGATVCQHLNTAEREDASRPGLPSYGVRELRLKHGEEAEEFSDKLQRGSARIWARITNLATCRTSYPVN